MDLKQAHAEYEKLKNEIDAYQYAIAITNFDLATIAPKNGIPFASKAIGVLAGELFEIKVSSKIRTVLDVFENNKGSLTPVTLREMELLKEDIEQLEKIPKDEYMEYAQLQSMSQFIWEEAKESCDFDLFLPYLEKLVAFTKHFAKLTKPEMTPYNACLDDYEKGLTTDELDIFFAAIREKTVPLLHRIMSEGKEIRNDFNSRSYSVDKQELLSYKILDMIGFDKDAGVLATSEHPFTSGINGGDVRLTTHFYENDLSSALTSTMHEGGHGLYEQKSRVSPIIKDSMLIGGVSMGIHESQSRFYENIIFRSREFCDYFFPIIKAEFPEELADVSAEEFYEAINIAKPKLIRIEADELTYNLHIMIRYELEKDLLEGKIEVKELPELWSQKYEDYLGIRPNNVTEGVL